MHPAERSSWVRQRSMKATRWVRASLLTPLLMCACSLETDPRIELRMAEICCYHDDDPQIGLPDTTIAGVPTMVSVTSYGGGCHRGGPTEVTTTAAEVQVTPFDSVYLHPVCTRELRSFEHTVALTFLVPGVVTVGVHGLSADTLALYERVVVVQ